MQLHNNLHSTPGPFITQVAQTLANGHHLIQLSRQYRKRLPPLQLRLDGTHIVPASKQAVGVAALLSAPAPGLMDRGPVHHRPSLLRLWQLCVQLARPPATA